MAAEPSAADPFTATTREELLVLHRAARASRDAAAPGGHEWEQASMEVGRIEVEIARIEVEIARIEREMTPPRV
jgi:hypothetical protein